MRRKTAWYWIGLNDERREGNFVWSDGSIRNYTNWNNGEPNNAINGEDCTVTGYSIDWKWNDARCKDKYYYVCKIPGRFFDSAILFDHYSICQRGETNAVFF